MWVSRLQLSMLLRVSVRTLASLDAEGKISPEQRGKGRRPSLYRLDDAIQAYLKHVTFSSQRPGAASDREARARRDNATALLTELRIARERGEFVSRDQVTLEGIRYTTAWRAMVLMLPHQLLQRGLITRETMPNVQDACRALLTAVSSWKVPADMDHAVSEALKVHRGEGDGR